MAAQPPELIDDVVAQILLRIPPDESAYLARASLVCKLWRRIISDPGFTRLYREFHRTPPLLGFLHNTERGRLFFPTVAACPFPRSPAFDCGRWWDLDYRRLRAFDCRHGRVLLKHDGMLKFIVWDPISGGQEVLDRPYHVRYLMCNAMVLCAAAGCDHAGCRGGGPFLVAFVGICDGWANGCVYSSEARAWGKPASLHLGAGRRTVDWSRGALVGDDAYFIVCNGDIILKYDLRRNRLSAINPPGGYKGNITVMSADNGASLGFAGIMDRNLDLWSRKVDDDPKGARVVARWVRCRVVELDKLLPVVNWRFRLPLVMGSAEGAGVVFVRVGTSAFMIELKSGQASKVSEPGEFSNALPFMSFHASAGSASSVSPLPAEGK